MIGSVARLMCMLLGVIAAAGCAAHRVNPSFPMTVAEAREDWQRMCDRPVSAARPIVIVGGYADAGLAPNKLSSRLHSVLGSDAVIIPVDIGFTSSMTAARERLLKRVNEAIPEAGSGEPPEVDVVALSMGG